MELLFGLGLKFASVVSLIVSGGLAIFAAAGDGRTIMLPVVAVVLLAGTVALLFSGLADTLTKLRGVEILLVTIVGGLAILRGHQLIVSEVEVGAIQAAWNATLINTVLVITGYALIVPNTIKHGAWFIVSLGLAPFVMIAFAQSTVPAVDTAITAAQLGAAAGWISVAVVSAGVGCTLLGFLRQTLATEKGLGMYALQELIGRGGMGEVWRAEHQRLARPTAVKLIRPDRLAGDKKESERLMRRFEQEAQATAALRSPHTVEVYDFGVSGSGIFYYVMEYLEGVDLEAFVNRYGPMAPARVAFLMQQVCESLGEAHDAGLVHRDIKPANIHCARLGQRYDFAKVLDFGLVKPKNGTAEATRLTMDGATRGTPAFLPPEVVDDAPLDRRADIYALGCVGYWLLTGALVFEADDPVRMAVAHVTETPVPPSERSEQSIPADFEAVIMRCLAKAPDDRYQDTEALSAALEACNFETQWSNAAAQTWWHAHRPTESHA